MKKTILIAAGEVSGEKIAVSLSKAIREIDSDIKICGIGGSLVRKAGIEVVKEVTSHAVIGTNPLYIH